MEKKLELSQLKNYLGVGLKFYKKTYNPKVPDFLDVMEMKSIDTFSGEVGLIESISNGGYTKPISELYLPAFFHLSDLDKFIPELGFVPRDKLTLDDCFIVDGKIYACGDEYDYSVLRYYTLKQLFEWHFWVFDQSYFEEGLIIDKLKQS